jgi:Protein of unknown function (DUF1360)
MGVWYRLVLGALVTWRLTHLLNAEDGPWQVLVKLRRAAGNGMLGQLLDCFYCLSLWVAAPLAYLLGESWTERLLLVPALSAAAIVVERVAAPPMPHYVEDSEEPDGMLRKEPDHHDDDSHPDDDSHHPEGDA